MEEWNVYLAVTGHNGTSKELKTTSGFESRAEAQVFANTFYGMKYIDARVVNTTAP